MHSLQCQGLNLYALTKEFVYFTVESFSQFDGKQRCSLRNISCYFNFPNICSVSDIQFLKYAAIHHWCRVDKFSLAAYQWMPSHEQIAFFHSWTNIFYLLSFTHGCLTISASKLLGGLSLRAYSLQDGISCRVLLHSNLENAFYNQISLILGYGQI